MEVITERKTEKQEHLDGASVAALFFGTVAGLVFPPFAVLMLFTCVLEILTKAWRPESEAVKNDKDFYRRFVRPIGRFLAWAPVAALIVICLLGIACLSRMLSGVLVIAIPFVLGYIAIRVFNQYRPIQIAEQQKRDCSLTSND